MAFSVWARIASSAAGWRDAWWKAAHVVERGAVVQCHNIFKPVTPSKEQSRYTSTSMSAPCSDDSDESADRGEILAFMLCPA